MLEFICSIPEGFGWLLVSLVAILCGIIIYADIKIVCQMIKDRYVED